MNESPPPPSGLLKAYAAAARWSLWLLLAFWLVLVLAWGALHGWIVPRIGELRPDLEIEATRVLGVPVRIGEITARTEGLVPSFELTDVVLLDPQGRVALRLPRVVAALSPRSLWNLGFDQLYVERPQLDIRRAANGKIFVAGLDLSRGSDNDGRAADWFFRQTEFVIREGTLRWTDEMRGAPPLELRDVDLAMRNTARRHQMRLDATPPAEWGDRFSLRGLFRQPLLSVHHGRWQEWDGQLFADFARVDLSRLRRHADLGVEVASGRGAVRAWADVSKGQLTGAMADLALHDVNTTLGERLAPLALDSLAGRLSGRRLAGGFEFETRELQFQTREGQRWPGGNVYVNWVDAQGAQPARGELRADKLDLAALSQIATRLPLGTATHTVLADRAPKGLVQTLQAKWQGPLDSLQKYQARGQAVQLEIAARRAVAPAAGKSAPDSPGAAKPGRDAPGVRGAAIDFDFTEAGGKGRLTVDKGALDLPGVFEDPVIAFEQLSADVSWQVKGEQMSLSVARLKFSNVDAQGEGDIHWRTGDTASNRLPGVLDLRASLSRATGNRVWRYLPLGVGKAARDYVREGVEQGVATEARFRVKGDLRDFPFSHGRPGEFQINAQIKDATYAFVPASLTRGNPWPALTQLSGELVFDRSSMQVRNAVGRFVGAPGLQVKADVRIPELHTTTVSVTAQVAGPLAESLAIVNRSPLAEMTGGALAKASATGNADLRLQLVLPVAQLARSQVQGSLTLAGNDLQITTDSPPLARARGTVAFNQHGFTLAGVQARAMGGDVRIDGGSRGPAAATAGAEASVLVRVQGTATADGLRQARELGFLSRLAKHASGGAAYTATLGVRKGVPEIMVSSNLQGLALDLPPPLAKSAEALLPLRYENALLPEAQAAAYGPPGKLMDQLSIELGRIGAITYIRDLSGAEPRVLRGGIALGLAAGESAPLPESGVMANVNLSSVNLDAWEDVLSAAAGGATVAAAAGVSPLRSASGPGYLPTVMAVRARELVVEGRTLHNVVVGGSRDGLVWRANVDAAELNGYMEYRQASEAGAGRVHARLARLAIAAGAAREVEALLDTQPAHIPALDIVVEDFELRGKKLGRLEIDAVNRGAGTGGGVREWRLNKLGLTMPEGVFNATGNWAALDAQAAAAAGPRAGADRRRTVMNFKLDVADSGLLLARFGMKDVVRRGKGKMEGQVAWLGSPLSLDYPSMTGAFNVNMEGGQFLKADPGLAKLLGVLSLQSLPRRLTLDFRDVFTEGFAFDFVRGDITIAQGIAATNNLQMKGVNAAVLMEGKADIARETQDVKVVVIPEINAGTASLVAGVINPAIGLGTFLAQMFLRQPLMRAATQEFHIDGTWADPRITKVDRRAASPQGRADAEPAAPAKGTN